MPCEGRTGGEEPDWWWEQEPSICAHMAAHHMPSWNGKLARGAHASREEVFRPGGKKRKKKKRLCEWEEGEEVDEGEEERLQICLNLLCECFYNVK